MIDSKLAGTGNSRFLKSVSNFKTLYPTYDDFVAALVAGTLPIDLNGINPDGWTQQGTPLNKANLLSDDVANDLGLVDDATPNGAFNAIISAKGKSNGFATLDSSGKVPSTQLPSMNYIPTSQKGAANGVATLDNNKKLNTAQLPDMYPATKFSSVSVESDNFSTLDVDAYICGRFVFLHIIGVTKKINGSTQTIWITSPNIPCPIPDVKFPGILRFIIASDSEGYLWTYPFGAVHAYVSKSYRNIPAISIDNNIFSPDYPYANVAGGIMYISE